MKLSIVIPVYNVESFVKQTLETVFATGATDFEIIVVNDGTKDRSMDIVREFADWPNLRIIEQRNQGLSAARNRGLEAAQGEFVWFVDSDDYLLEDGVGKVLDLLEKRPETDVLMFPLEWGGEDGTFIRLDIQVKEERSFSGKELIRNRWFPLWAVQRFVFRRSIAQKRDLRFPVGLIHEDEFFGPALVYCAETVRVFDKPVYCYRSRGGSIMSSQSVRSCYDKVSIHRKLILFAEKNVEKEDMSWFREYCFWRLELIYSDHRKAVDASSFRRFANRRGFYVWKEWLMTHPESTLRRRVGRLLFFMNPHRTMKIA